MSMWRPGRMSRSTSGERLCGGDDVKTWSTKLSGEKIRGVLCTMCMFGTTRFCKNCRCCRHICNCGKFEPANKLKGR